MKLNTKYHGIKDYYEEDVIIFNKGIPGFEGLKKFILFSTEENEMFKILHSIEDDNVGLILTSPFTQFKDYEFNLNDEKLKELRIISKEDVVVLNTVTLSSKLENITINLKAPFIININAKIGEQIILNNESYSIKQSLYKG
ncbi:flagellar assembly protein FliW [Candidatus Clostridium radicumherbarum]|uniref:Flagellar assembly factor FliW n=1 Tax=Candidatus Clostridium radicumherbarum TaxID=3381662 RepID=A0ABW8TWH5_9CLOT